MKYFVSVLMMGLMSLFTLTSCSSSQSSSQSSSSVVSLRDFDKGSVSVSNVSVNNLSTMDDSGGEAVQGIVTSNILESASSDVYCEEGVADCVCDNTNVSLDQIFLKPDMESEEGHTFLYQNGKATGASHEFAASNVIGIDIQFKGEDVRMSDVYVFDQDIDSEYAFKEGVAEDVFVNEKNDTHSVSYDFPIGSTKEAPMVSITGCWMKIILDFK